jgi:long-chain acyl-CoA synthetase
MGFWNNPDETSRVLEPEGWLHTGDKARIENGHIYITGRIKDIIVMANGEKISPADMETAITGDSLFEHVQIIGEARPYLAAIVVINAIPWQKFAKENGLSDKQFDDPECEEKVLMRIAKSLHEFPGYAEVRKITCSEEPWTVENGLLTPTLKVKRKQVTEKFQVQIDKMYEGHLLSK